MGILQNHSCFALRLLSDPQRPLQIIYAGKAHPNDTPGKELIQAIINLARQPEFRRHIVFLENYDVAIARYMVQGCDVWLNTPLRPLEASGTSGMKAQANGVLNVSTLDGWWDEAWRMSDGGASEVGWAIGRGEDYEDHVYQDKVEAEALYELLETDVAPTFYDRRADGLPRRWIARMRFSIARLCPEFSMHRMVKQYTENYYEVAHARYRVLDSDQASRAKALAAWMRRIREAWPQVQVQALEAWQSDGQNAGQVHIRAVVFLGATKPEDVTVEVVLGPIDADGYIKTPASSAMQAGGEPKPGTYAFDADVRPSSRSGLHGFTVRVLPRHADLVTPHIPGLATWAVAPTVFAGPLDLNVAGSKL